MVAFEGTIPRLEHELWRTLNLETSFRTRANRPFAPTSVGIALGRSSFARGAFLRLWHELLEM